MTYFHIILDPAVLIYDFHIFITSSSSLHRFITSFLFAAAKVASITGDDLLSYNKFTLFQLTSIFTIFRDNVCCVSFDRNVISYRFSETIPIFFGRLRSTFQYISM